MGQQNKALKLYKTPPLLTSFCIARYAASKKYYLFIKNVHYCIGMLDLWKFFEESGKNSFSLRWASGEEKFRVHSLTSRNEYSCSSGIILYSPKELPFKQRIQYPNSKIP